MPRPPKDLLATRRIETGERIRSLRQAQGLSQTKLAQVLGVNQSHVSNIERGARSVTIQQLTRLSKRLGVSIDVILTGSRTKSQPQVRTLRSGKLLRCLQRLEELAPADQKAVLRILESLLERHAAAPGTKRAGRAKAEHQARVSRAARDSRPSEKP